MSQHLSDDHNKKAPRPYSRYSYRSIKP